MLCKVYFVYGYMHVYFGHCEYVFSNFSLPLSMLSIGTSIMIQSNFYFLFYVAGCGDELNGTWGGDDIKMGSHRKNTCIMIHKDAFLSSVCIGLGP